MRAGSGTTLRTLGIRPSKRLGQNFLVDRGIAERIVTAAEVTDRSVLEIGPGLGALSDRLAERARHLTLIEIDARLAEFLTERFSGREHVKVVRGDALEVDFDCCPSVRERSRVVANLPYRAGSQILLRLYDEQRRFDSLVVMLQKEVADRLVARAGDDDYGLLSIWTALWGESRVVLRVSRGAFLPVPKVDSVVVRVDLRTTPSVELSNPTWFRRIVRASFGQRRKTLRRALSGLVDAEHFSAAEIDSGRRGETLDLREFARLAEASARDA